MPKTKIVELSEPIGSLRVIVLREPRFSDFLMLGAPATWVQLPGGGGFLQDNPSVIAAFAERLSDIDPSVIPMLSLRDGLAIRALIIGFFIEAATPLEAADADRSLASEEASFQPYRQ
jgi:hypothetical protein